MADGQDEFRAAQRDRVLPTCPPQTSLDNKHQRCTFDRSYRPSDGRGKVRNFTLCDPGVRHRGASRWVVDRYPRGTG